MTQLAFGPMSREIVEAIYSYSQEFSHPLMLICSRNQVDYEHGYVFKTSAYREFLDTMKAKYPDSNIGICRDHCGPGFGTPDDSMESVKKTIAADLENGFNLIHIDLCNLKVERKDKVVLTKQLMDFATGINPDVLFEVGTEENVGVPASNLKEIGADLDELQGKYKPRFYVVQTGSLVKENYNAGSFSRDAVAKAQELLSKYGVALKEHNADYLTKEQIAERKWVVHAMNIAPQLGVIQTCCVLNLCQIYGVDSRLFKEVVYKGGKWKKWLLHNTEANKDLCVNLAGHYHFNSDEYKKITEQLWRSQETVIESIKRVIGHYHRSLA